MRKGRSETVTRRTDYQTARRMADISSKKTTDKTASIKATSRMTQAAMRRMIGVTITKETRKQAAMPC